MSRHPETTKDWIAKAQQLVDAGKYREAHELYESHIIMADAPEIGSYQTMGDLWIQQVGMAASQSKGYRRALDVATGLVTVTQPLADGSILTEQAISSAVDDCIAIRLTSTAAHGLDFDVSVTHPIAKLPAGVFVTPRIVADQPAKDLGGPVEKSLEYARCFDGDTALKALDILAARPSPIWR